MPIVEDFTLALDELAAGEASNAISVPVLLMRACSCVLYAAGTSLSLLSAKVRMPMGASNHMADRAERLQFTLGEGPCLEVYRSGQAERFTEREINEYWPLYAAELFEATPYRSCASFPLDLGDGLYAALDVYLESPDGPPDALMSDAEVLGDEIVAALSLTTEGVPQNIGPSWLRTESMTRRANVWISMALLSTHTSLPPDDVVALLRAYAVGRGITLDQVTGAIAALELDPRTVLD